MVSLAVGTDVFSWVYSQSVNASPAIGEKSGYHSLTSRLIGCGGLGLTSIDPNYYRSLTKGFVRRLPKMQNAHGCSVEKMVIFLLNMKKERSLSARHAERLRRY